MSSEKTKKKLKSKQVNVNQPDGTGKAGTGGEGVSGNATTSNGGTSGTSISSVDQVPTDGAGGGGSIIIKKLPGVADSTTKQDTFKVSKISISPSRKMNLGDYETGELSAMVEIVFSESVSVDSLEVQDAFTAARKLVSREFEEQWKPLVAYKKKKIAKKKEKARTQ
jgi:hypothetical protein